MDDIIYACATIFLAPFCITLIILYLQQLKEVRSAAQDRKSALDEKAEAEQKCLQLEEDHRIHIESLKMKHQNEIQRKQREVDQVKALPKIIEFLKDNPDFINTMKERRANQSSETTD